MSFPLHPIAGRGVILDPKGRTVVTIPTNPDLAAMYSAMEPEQVWTELDKRTRWIAGVLNALEKAGVEDPVAFIEEAVTLRESPDCYCKDTMGEICDHCAARDAFDRSRGIKV